MRKTQNFMGFLALRTQSAKIHPRKLPLRYSKQAKRHDTYHQRAPFAWGRNYEFVATHGFDVFSYNRGPAARWTVLRSHKTPCAGFFCGRSAWITYSSSMLLVTNFGSSVRSTQLLLHFPKTCVVGMTSWPLTGLTTDEEAVVVMSWSTIRTKCWCHPSLYHLCPSVLSRGSYTWSPMVLKNIRPLFTYLFLCAEGALRSNARKKGCWLCRVLCMDDEARSKDPIRSYRKTKHGMLVLHRVLDVLACGYN